MNIEKPQPRKGFVITAVQWNAAGRVVSTKYQRASTLASHQRPCFAGCDNPACDSVRCFGPMAVQAITTPRRSAIATEQGRLL